MGRRAKIAMGGTLIAAGLVGATLFRRQDPPANEPAVQTPPAVESRRSATPSAATAPLRELPTTLPRLLGNIDTDEAPAGTENGGDVAPNGVGQWRPASGARSETPMEPQRSTSNGPVARQVMTKTDDAPAADSTTDFRLHVVHDGDTLSSLARRYLGSSGRYLEIYEANRDRLPSPDVLPIGAELRIPRRDRSGRSSSTPSR